MREALVLSEFIFWHYRNGIAGILRAWGNVHWFLFNYFSIPQLIRSFFAPFHRLQEQRKRGFDPENFFEVAILNATTRLVGALIRTVIIGVGLVAQCFVFVIGCAFAFLAFAAPAASPILVIVGFLYLIGV